jgi:hypothetical protein
MTTLRAAITQARSSARFVGRVVLEVALAGGSPADRAGTSGVPDLGQVSELDAWIVAPAFKPVVAILGGQRVEGDQQVRPIPGGVQPPGAVAARRRPVPAGRGEGEPRRSWPCAFPVVLGFGTCAAVPDSVAMLVGHGHAPRALRVGRGGSGQVAGQPGIDGAEPGQFARPSGQTSQGGQRDGQGWPARRTRPVPRQPGWAGPGGGGSLCSGAGQAGRGHESRPCRLLGRPCAVRPPTK